MTRITWNFAVDGFTLVAGLCVLTIGLLLRWVLPPRSGRTGLSLRGLDRRAWGDVHFWASALLIACALVHLVLHWQ